MSFVFRKVKGSIHLGSLISVGFMFLFFSCENNKNKVGAAYEGPVEIVNKVEILYSELGHQKVQMITRQSLKYANDNKIFPDTININFFDANLHSL
jgi:hypothetical protein